jgi:hypothetical protein
LGLPSYLDVPPRFGTLRNFDNPTYGDRLALTARLLGKPFIPWQRYVADVLGEVDPRTGIRVYREALVTLMRQGGKTTFIVGFKSHRALDCSTPQTIQFAAQDGIEAKKKWLQHAKLIKRTPLGVRLVEGTPTTSNGKEILEWDTGSTEIPLSGSEGSGHGDTLNLGVITEAFAHKDDRYMQTMRPAMNNDPSAQLLVESTQGTASSIWLNETTKEYRDRITADPAELTASRIAYFDWSFAEEDDIGSPVTWRRRIPQLGHLLRVEEVETAWRNATTPKKVRAFIRGYGNVADLGAGESSVFDEGVWERSETNDIIVGFHPLGDRLPRAQDGRGRVRHGLHRLEWASRAHGRRPREGRPQRRGSQPSRGRRGMRRPLRRHRRRRHLVHTWPGRPQRRSRRSGLDRGRRQNLQPRLIDRRHLTALRDRDRPLRQHPRRGRLQRARAPARSGHLADDRLGGQP